MYQSQWRPDKTVLHLFPHWNWKDGQTIDMWAYYNNADEVELFINGESKGVRKPKSDKYHAEWRVKYVTGTVEVVSRKNGKEVARKSNKTAGVPYAIRLAPDRNTLRADGYDLSYITVEVVDKDGNLCPWAENEVTFSVDGSGFIAGVDNGSPISLESFKSDKRKAFYGKAMLIIQSNGKSGKINIKAESPDIKSGNVSISVL